MNRSLPTLSLVALAGVLLGGCAAGPVMMQDVQPLAAAWEAAYEAGDEDAIAALYADDAVVLLTDVPPLRGANAIRDYYASVPPGLDLQTTTEEVGGEGDRGHAHGQYAITSSGSTIAQGNWVLLLERADDAWRIRRHVAVSDMTADQQAAVMMLTLSPIAAAYEVAYNEGDRDALADLYTRDALLLPPHASPIRGRTFIREALITQPGVQIDIDLHRAIDLGENAHAYGTVTFMAPGGEVLDRANWSGVFTLENESWKIDRMMWSSEMPLAAQATPALQAAIESATMRFGSAARAGDAAEIASLYTSTATLMPPNRAPVQGAQAIERYWGRLFDDGVTAVDLETARVAGLGDTAHEMGLYTIDAGDTRLDEGKYLVVWKWEDGAWKMHYDIWNSSRTPQAM